MTVAVRLFPHISHLTPHASPPNRLAPLRPRALTGEKGAGGMKGPTARKAACRVRGAVV